MLYKEKTKIDKEKQDMETKLNEMKNDCDKLQKEVHCQVQLLVLTHVLLPQKQLIWISLLSITKQKLILDVLAQQLQQPISVKFTFNILSGPIARTSLGG